MNADAMHLRVEGTCPACDRSSLFVGEGGYLTCSVATCADPLAASKALGIAFVGDDPERFCPTCFAGIESSEHFEKCEATQ